MVDKKLVERDELYSVLERVSNEIGAVTDCYLIGGLAMIFHGTKVATKDVDIVFTSDEDAERFEEAAAKFKFGQEAILSTEYDKLGTRKVLSSPEGHQFDIFVNIVCRGLHLTEHMKGRAEKILELENLNVYAVSMQDIFLFKGITDRPDDLADMAMIAGSGIDWDSVEKEILSQPESWKWIPVYYSRLLELEAKYDIVSPSIKKLKEESELYIGFNIVLDHLEKGPMSFSDIENILDEDLTFVKHVIDKMIKNGLIGEENGLFSKIEASDR
jgi:hypothetical protein